MRDGLRLQYCRDLQAARKDDEGCSVFGKGPHVQARADWVGFAARGAGFGDSGQGVLNGPGLQACAGQVPGMLCDSKEDFAKPAAPRPDQNIAADN